VVVHPSPSASANSDSQTLKAPEAGAFDRFGWDLALDGDRLVAGEPGEDPDGETNAGAAHVYQTGSI
jgi:hypothetical protein